MFHEVCVAKGQVAVTLGVAVGDLQCSLCAEVRISVDLVAQVQHAVHVSDDPRQAVPQPDPLDVRVAVAAHPVGGESWREERFIFER